jgi:hypothetical protein
MSPGRSRFAQNGRARNTDNPLLNNRPASLDQLNDQRHHSEYQ